MLHQEIMWFIPHMQHQIIQIIDRHSEVTYSRAGREGRGEELERALGEKPVLLILLITLICESCNSGSKVLQTYMPTSVRRHSDAD